MGMRIPIRHRALVLRLAAELNPPCDPRTAWRYLVGGATHGYHLTARLDEAAERLGIRPGCIH